MAKLSHSETLMGMDEAVWARHANPWSGWTRLTILPLFALAVWSRVWLGWWCLFPLTLVIAWTWWNPRAFRPPTHMDHWMSKGVLGERIWLARKGRPVPAHHRRVPFVLAAFSGLGVLPYGWGLWQLDIWPVVVGIVLMAGGKLWFIDRMVWLFEDTHSR